MRRCRAATFERSGLLKSNTVISGSSISATDLTRHAAAALVSDTARSEWMTSTNLKINADAVSSPAQGSAGVCHRRRDRCRGFRIVLVSMSRILLVSM